MEEMKQVKVEETKKTYDELVELNSQLINQCKMLQSKLRQDDISMTFARLDYLFKILDHKEAFSASFLEDVSQEIARIMEVSETTVKNVKSDENK